jgi:2-phospho-L-lactate guanylyltransferase
MQVRSTALAGSRSMTTPADLRYGVLVPLKRAALAKTRLAPLGDLARTQLVAAFAADTVTAAMASSRVGCVLVVTDDHHLAAQMRALGAEVVPDGVADDLNGSLVQAAAELHRRRPELGVAALCADLPALRTDELTAALTAASEHDLAFVPDASGTGTTLVAASTLRAFRPCFGEGSRDEHLLRGGREIAELDVPTLRRDVDTPGDLEATVSLGVGSRTSLVLEGLRL